MKINWFELKYFDTSTNHSPRIEVIKCFLKEKIDVTYHCSYKIEKKYYDLDNTIINYIDVPKIRYIRGVLILLIIFFRSSKAYFIEINGVQLVDYKSIYACIPVLLLNKLYKRQVFILDIRTYPVGKFYEKIPKTFTFPYYVACKLCDGVSYITKVMKDDLLTATSVKPKASICWGSGYNPQKFYTTESHTPTSGKILNLIYHGGISKSRGLLDLIKAVEICNNNGKNVKLTLIGVWVDEVELKHYIKINNLCSVIKCSDPVPISEIPKFVAQADMGILPFPDFVGWRVSSPIKLFEYLGMGKPVIVTEIDCFTEELGKTPFVVYAKNSTPDNLALAIEKAFQLKRDLQANAQLASDMAIANYTWQAQANKLINFVKLLSQ